MKTLLAFILFALSSLTYVNAMDNKTIRISTKDTDLILQVGENGRLYQTYLGEKYTCRLGWQCKQTGLGSVQRFGQRRFF